MTRVAFLGLGAMGRPMCGRLLEAGHELTVWNRTSGRDEALVSEGARRAATPSEAARDAEVVITMLADPPALEHVLFGPDGVAGGIGREAVLVDMSTVGPSAVRVAAERLRPTRMVDAPVLGTTPHAAAGTLVIVTGGEREAVERVTPVLETLGTVLPVGPSGAGATVKLANNAAAMSALVGVGEVLALTDRAGIDAETVLDALGRGPLASAVERWRDKLTGRDGSVTFRLALARKDLALAAEEAGSLGVRLTISEAALARCEEAVAAGHGDDDNTAVVEVVRAAG